MLCQKQELVLCAPLVRRRCVIFFFKQKTAYERRISDWSSDVCSSDLHELAEIRLVDLAAPNAVRGHARLFRQDTGSKLLRRHFEREEKKIGKATCRARVCKYVSISVVAGSLKRTTASHTRLSQHRRILYTFQTHLLCTLIMQNH